MPRMSADDAIHFLHQPHTGVIATLRRDGMPYTVPIWWLWESDPHVPDFTGGTHTYPGAVVWITGTTTRVWCKQLMADDRASLCIEAGPPETGHIGFDGRCTAVLSTEFDIWPITRRLVEKYVGRDDPDNDAAVEGFYQNMKTEPRLLFKMVPTVMRAIDMRIYRGKRADRRPD